MLFENVQGDYGVSYIISYIIFKLFFFIFFVLGGQPYTYNFENKNFQSDVRQKLEMIHKQETVFVCYVNIKENQVYLAYERPVNMPSICQPFSFLHEIISISSTWRLW